MTRFPVVVFLAGLLAACGTQSDLPVSPMTANVTGAPEPAGLASLRQATAAYHSVDQAIAAGYAEPEAAACVAVPGLGAMGVHSVNLALASDLTVDPRRPEVLLYLPLPGGRFRLVGVEYAVAALVLTPTGPAPWFEQAAPPYPFFNPAPSVLGHVFDGPMAGHEEGMPWHYDLHAWIWEPNPSGDFAPFNPNLSCPEN